MVGERHIRRIAAAHLVRETRARINIYHEYSLPKQPTCTPGHAPTSSCHDPHVPEQLPMCMQKRIAFPRLPSEPYFASRRSSVRTASAVPGSCDCARKVTWLKVTPSAADCHPDPVVSESAFPYALAGESQNTLAAVRRCHSRFWHRVACASQRAWDESGGACLQGRDTSNVHCGYRAWEQNVALRNVWRLAVALELRLDDLFARVEQVRDTCSPTRWDRVGPVSGRFCYVAGNSNALMLRPDIARPIPHGHYAIYKICSHSITRLAAQLAAYVQEPR